MGWNDSRITLLAPGWDRAYEFDSSEIASHDQVLPRISYPRRSEEGGSADIDPARFQAWIESLGFTLKQQSELGNRLQCDEVEAILTIEDDSLAELVLTFMLTRDSIFRVPAWSSLVKAIIDKWHFALYDPELGIRTGSEAFVKVLSKTQAWQDFQFDHNWPAIDDLPYSAPY